MAVCTTSTRTTSIDGSFHFEKSFGVTFVGTNRTRHRCEYIFYRGLYRTSYARVSRSTITDTELQIGQFALPKHGFGVTNDTQEARYLRAWKEELPESHVGFDYLRFLHAGMWILTLRIFFSLSGSPWHITLKKGVYEVMNIMYSIRYGLPRSSRSVQLTTSCPQPLYYKFPEGAIL